MKIYPEIFVTGFPNSGTSFLCNLITVLGKSPGKQNDLKQCDQLNRYGYYENLALRNISHELLLTPKFDPFIDKTYDKNNYLFNEKSTEILNRFNKLAQEDSIEVFKDNALPYIHQYYSPEAKYICIIRDYKSCYNSRIKANVKPHPVTINEFKNFYKKYHELVDKMSKEKNCLLIHYKDFKDNYESLVKELCSFLEVEVTEELMRKAKGIYKPRKMKFKNYLYLLLHKLKSKK